MIRNRYGHGATFRAALHDDVAATLTDHLETVLLEDLADIPSREDAKLTHEPLRSE